MAAWVAPSAPGTVASIAVSGSVPQVRELGQVLPQAPSADCEGVLQRGEQQQLVCGDRPKSRPGHRRSLSEEQRVYVHAAQAEQALAAHPSSMLV